MNEIIDFKNLSGEPIEQLLAQRRICKDWIASDENDGRLSTGSSAELDWHMDAIESIEREIWRRMKEGATFRVEAVERLPYGNVKAMWELAKQLERELIEATAKIDMLLAHCGDPECSECAKIICPHHDDMHFHHDGCPSCAEDGPTESAQGQA